MRRRSFVASSIAAAALSRPALAQDRRASTLRFVPQSSLTTLDPILTTAGVTLDHGYAVFDTLYGTDQAFQPVPQMAESHQVSDDGRTWMIRLRDGLRFHDGEPVRAADCAASMQRWTRRDTFGQTLGAAVDTWDAADDRTMRVQLKRPFPRLLSALAFVGPIAPFIMPERLAQTDPYKAVTELVGSGPFRFVPGEFVSGSRVVYEKFDSYVPREGAPFLNSGAKVAKFDRIEWQVIPDSATAASALQAGEVDWWEFADADLVPLLSGNKAIRVADYDPLGFVAFLRFNSLVPPFNNAALKRAVLAAVDQSHYMPLITGGDASAWRTAYSMFPMGLPFVREVGAPVMGGAKDMAALRKAVAASGYNGERVVILSPSDIPSIAPFGEVTAALCKQLGLNVDLQVMDWGTVDQRRNSREPVEKGGWSLFHTTWKSRSVANPSLNNNIRGQGGTGWFGWFQDAAIEQMTEQWLDAAGDAEQQRLYDAIQLEAFDKVPSVPLGQFVQKTAYRADIAGVLPGPAAFPWNVYRT